MFLGRLSSEYAEGKSGRQYASRRSSKTHRRWLVGNNNRYNFNTTRGAHPLAHRWLVRPMDTDTECRENRPITKNFIFLLDKSFNRDTLLT